RQVGRAVDAAHPGPGPRDELQRFVERRGGADVEQADGLERRRRHAVRLGPGEQVAVVHLIELPPDQAAAHPEREVVAEHTADRAVERGLLLAVADDRSTIAVMAAADAVGEVPLPAREGGAVALGDGRAEERPAELVGPRRRLDEALVDVRLAET